MFSIFLSYSRLRHIGLNVEKRSRVIWGQYWDQCLHVNLINIISIVTYGARRVITTIVSITSLNLYSVFENKLWYLNSHFAVLTNFFIKIIKITLPNILGIYKLYHYIVSYSVYSIKTQWFLALQPKVVTILLLNIV